MGFLASLRLGAREQHQEHVWRELCLTIPEEKTEFGSSGYRAGLVRRQRRFSIFRWLNPPFFRVAHPGSCLFFSSPSYSCCTYCSDTQRTGTGGRFCVLLRLPPPRPDKFATYILPHRILGGASSLRPRVSLVLVSGNLDYIRLSWGHARCIAPVCFCLALFLSCKSAYCWSMRRLVETHPLGGVAWFGFHHRLKLRRFNASFKTQNFAWKSGKTSVCGLWCLKFHRHRKGWVKSSAVEKKNVCWWVCSTANPRAARKLCFLLDCKTPEYPFSSQGAALALSLVGSSSFEVKFCEHTP